MSFLFTIFAGLVLSVCAPTLHKVFKGNVGWVTSIVPTSLFVYFATFLPKISRGDTVTQAIEWVPSLDINLYFYLDGLSLMMALLVTGVGALVFIYAGGYLHDDPNLGRFLLFLSVFMSAMLGVVLAGNILLLFIFWEMTSISSYMLIGYKHEYGASRDSAKQALIITGGGGLALLAGLIFTGHAAGTYNLIELVTGDHWLGNHDLYLWAFLFVAIGAFTKSAQVPFHFWLPGAMAAPTPVSSYLHSATMVKAGIYLLARLTPVLGGTATWFYVVTGFGATTMFVGAFLSWQNKDLKKILAYSTISVLGTLMMLIGLGASTEYAIKALVIVLLSHAFYKGCLFMVAGAIDHETGTRDITQLSGLRHKMPITFLAACVAALSKAGIPLFFGFIGKELLYEATLHAPPVWLWCLTILAVISNSMVGVASALLIIKPFLGKEVVAPSDHVHEAPLSMWIGPAVLSGFSLILGLLPLLMDDFGTHISKAIVGGDKLAHRVYYDGADSSYNDAHQEAPNSDDAHEDEHSSVIKLSERTRVNPAGDKDAGPLDMHLLIWHGADMVKDGKPTPLLLSIITVGLLGVLYTLRDRLVPIVRPLRGDEWGAKKIYDVGFEGILDGAKHITHFVQNGNLRWYISVILSSFVLLVFYVLLFRSNGLDQIQFDASSLLDPSSIYELLLLFTIVVGAFFTVWFETRMASIASLGVVGFGMAMFFVLFQAPDLAMTQFAIETLSVILIALIIGRLPEFFPEKNKSFDQTISIIIAAASGILVMLLSWIVLSMPLESRLTPYFVETSKLLAHGRNVVNVILVDFRGFDTFGEITVLSIAGIGVYAFSKLRASNKVTNKPIKEQLQQIEKRDEEA